MDTKATDIARAEVMTVLDRRIEASRAKDIDRLMAVYSPGIVLFDIIPPHQFTGACEVRRNFPFPINPKDWSAVVDVAP